MASNKKSKANFQINNLITAQDPYSHIVPQSIYVPHQIEGPHYIRIVQRHYHKNRKTIQCIELKYRTLKVEQISSGQSEKPAYTVKDTYENIKYKVNGNKLERVKDQSNASCKTVDLTISHYDRLQIQSVSMADQTPKSILTSSRDIYIRYFNVKTVRMINFVVAVPMDDVDYYDWDFDLHKQYFESLRADTAFRTGKKVYVFEGNRVYEVRIFNFNTSHNVMEIGNAIMSGILVSYWRYSKDQLKCVWRESRCRKPI